MARRPTREKRSYDATGPDKKFMDLARARFKQASDADQDQRDRERDDIKFYAGEQWPADILRSRKGQAASGGLPPIPERPSLVINKVKEPVRQVLNQERQSDLAIELVPADDFGGLTGPIDDTEIELREGLIRRIQRESHAADARTWAFNRATIAGRGFYLVMTRYGEGKTNDQEIYIQRIYNQAAVSLDPAHEQPDGSDAEWGFLATLMPYDQYQAEFPHVAERPNKLGDLADSDFTALHEEYGDWFDYDDRGTKGRKKDTTRMVRVVDYFYTERKSRMLATFPDGRVEWVDELPDGTTGYETRPVVEKTIHWCKLDGVQKLDSTQWPGRYIPIIKVVGEELQPFDAERRFEGMVRPSRGSQQGFNFMVSKWVETIGLTPIPPLMLDPEQIASYESWYQMANTRTLPYLPLRSYDDQGRQFLPPARPPVDPPIAAIAGSVQMFDEAIKSTTGIPDPTLGNVDPTLKSGKAIDLVQRQAQLGTSNYLDNLARSVRYEAIIVNDLLYPIYGRPGRLARIVNGDGKAETVMLHKPYTVQGKKPQPIDVPEGQPLPEGAKSYTLTKDANFNVAIKIAKNQDTRRQQQNELVGNLIGASPALMGVIGDKFFESLDGPEANEMAERIKATLDPRVLAVLEAKAKGQQLSPEAQMQIQQMQQMIQQLSQQLEQANKDIETQGVKAQADLQKAQLSEQSKLQIADLQRQTQLQIAQMEIDTKLKIEALKAQTSATKSATDQEQANLSREDEQRHEMALKVMDLTAKEQQQERAASQQAEQADIDRAEARTARQEERETAQGEE
ncbi:MAG TPA: portal protein [Gemmatimonadaceae bacterium]|nr:portal protein [Gemmatimonadaceae bacterium]